MSPPATPAAPDAPTCLWLGTAGGIMAGATLGLAEALWVLTGTGAGEYWALFAGVLVYGAVGGLLGLILGVALAGLRLLGAAVDPARGLSTVAVLIGCGGATALVGEALILGVYRRRGLPVDVTLALGAAVVACGVATAWLLPIFLTRTPLKALLRPKGALAAWSGLLLLAAVFSLSPAPGGGGPVAPERAPDAVHAEAPDVLLIAVDGLRPDDLERTGLAELAARGVRFEAAFAQAGWGGGALASVLTGAPPAVHRVLGPADTRDRALPTLLEVLQTEGYATAWIEGGADGPRAAGLVSGVDWTARPGRGDRMPESPRRLRLVRLLERDGVAAIDHDAVLGSVEGVIAANRARGNRWAVVVRLDASDDSRASAIATAVGDAITRMDARGDLERTVIALVGSTARSDGPRDLGDATLRVPLVLVQPDGALAGLRASWTVRTMDLAPTLVVRARGTLPPDWWAQDLLEQDAVDFLTGRIAPPPDRDFVALPDGDVISSETLARPVIAAQDVDGVSRMALREGGWKFVRRQGPDGQMVEEVYDLTTDPAELRNVAGQAARERVRMGHALDRLLGEWSGSEDACSRCIATVADPADCVLACVEEP